MLFASSLRLIGQLMHIVEVFCIRLQSLAPHGPNKNPHLDDSLGSLALLLLSTWPEITYESVLRIALLIPIVFSFRSPKRRASYSTMLFVQLKSNFIA
jgi:hypothetical protein